MGSKAEDKIRVNLEAIALEEARREAEEAQRNEEEQQRAEEEERERLALAKAEEERRRQKQEEEARRKQEEEEAQRKQEAERLERERIEEEQRLQRKEALDQFYQRYGFAGVNEPRKGASCQVLKTSVTYPLHQAAELANEQIVEYLLQDGAMVNQTNSSKLTAAQVAKKKGQGWLAHWGAPLAWARRKARGRWRLRLKRSDRCLQRTLPATDAHELPATMAMHVERLLTSLVMPQAPGFQLQCLMSCQQWQLCNLNLLKAENQHCFDTG